MHKPLRDVNKLIEDKIGDRNLFNVEAMGRYLRTTALTEILCSMPANDYAGLRLVMAEKKVVFFLPTIETGGELREGGEIIFYLGTGLEKESFDKVKYVTAHELAHVIWHHDFPDKLRWQVESSAHEKAWEWCSRIR